MSYRTVKRVLGETSLERKCRWWFGLSLVVLLTLSFTWYGRRTDKLVVDRIKTLSEELWRAGWQKLHIEGMAQIEKPAGPDAGTDDAKIAYEQLANSSLTLARKFEWHALLPVTRDQLKPEYQNRAEEYLPQDSEEKQLVEEWFSIYGKRLPADKDAPEAWQPPTFSRSNTD